MEREHFSSRLGFILISAGCAIGLGNVWRFPYITGKYGGGAFVLIYLLFLFILGVPLVITELAVGRGSQKSMMLSFDVLEPKGSKWHLFKGLAMAGNVLLMMYYTTIAGWMILYCIKMLKGDFTGLDSGGVTQVFSTMTSNPVLTVAFMIITVLFCFFVCGGGLQNGVERIVKWIMACLFILMLALAIRSLTLPGAASGLQFYLKPDFQKMMDAGLSECIFAAMGQAFFTLGVGIGSLAIFGSYIDRSKRLAGEGVTIAVLDTIVAFLAGIIIFTACFSYGIAPQSGPPLIFIALPNVFSEMAGGWFWGFLFFLFMSCAALSTVIAVFQNIIAGVRDVTGWSLKKTCATGAAVMVVLCLPCALGFNLLSGIQPLGDGSTILDLEDFIFSNNIVPIGSLVYVLFCTSRWGWGFPAFLSEANAGNGLKFPPKARFYMSVILPAIILLVFVWGYIGS